jgi:MFS family permease
MSLYKSWLIWLCASLFYGYQYILRVIPNVLKAEITAVFHFDTILFGQFAGIYYLGYTLAHIPLGIMLDRFGPKYILPLSILLSLLGMVPMVAFHHPAYGIAGRFILGMGSSCAFIGLVKVVQLSFPDKAFNRMLSVGSIFGLMGAVFAGAPIIYLLPYIAWENIILISIILGGILAVILFFVLPPQDPQQSPSNLKSSFSSILSNKTVLLIAFAGGLMVGPLEGFVDAWASESLAVFYAFSKHQASQGVSLVYLGFACGLAGLSYTSDRFGVDKTIIFSGIMMVISFINIMGGYLFNEGVLIALFILGFFSAYQVPALYKSTLCSHKSASGLTTSFVNTIFMVFGLFFHTVIAGSIQFFSARDIDALNSGGCSISTYQKGFLIIPTCLIMGTFIFYYLAKSSKKA